MSAAMLDMMEKLDVKLKEKNKFTDVLVKIEQATGIKRLYLTLGVLSFWALYMIFGRGAELICNFIGFMYPAYASMGALESSRKDDDVKWLTYWVVFASMSTVEFFSDCILFYIPFYWLLKCVFLIWCFFPIENNGSNFVFNKIIRPTFLKNKETINTSVKKVVNSAKDIAAGAIDGMTYIAGNKEE